LTKPAGIILAAGESSRMGADKALLSYSGSTFLEHLIGLFLPRMAPVVVVLGHHAEEIRAVVAPRPGLEIIVNTQYQAGQLSSLQAGIRALPAEARAALLTLVDHPAVAAGTIDAMLAMLERLPAATPVLLIPRYRGRRGHPVLLGRALLEEILALPASASAKQVVRAHLGEAVFLDVDDPGVVGDVDTPADYRSLVEGRGGV
jgi:molybdenum cofactor cytidylyltransferase